MPLCATAAAEASSVMPARHSLRSLKRPRYKVRGNYHPCHVLALGTGKCSQANSTNCYMGCGAPGTSLTADSLAKKEDTVFKKTISYGQMKISIK